MVHGNKGIGPKGMMIHRRSLKYFKRFEVEAIMEAKDSPDGDDQNYLIKWEGYEAAWNTWEPSIHLKDCPDKLKEFLTTEFELDNVDGFVWDTFPHPDAFLQKALNCATMRRNVKIVRTENGGFAGLLTPAECALVGEARDRLLADADDEDEDADEDEDQMDVGHDADGEPQDMNAGPSGEGEADGAENGALIDGGVANQKRDSEEEF